ncbi:MAG TPA: MFS transporter, partial [Rhodothermales bacterium]|nr:MFS transporter [Rhodothermales bacterium]
FLICIPLAAYYSYAPVFLGVAGAEAPAGWMSIGQMSEVIFMLLMPLFFVRLGVKKMLLIGMGAWVLRYALFVLAAPAPTFWLIIVGVALHGICYDFFFVTGQIYVDKKSTASIRGQAQGFLVFATYGVGMFIGAWGVGEYYNSFLAGGAEALTLEQFETFWLVPAVFALGVMIFFGLFFKDKVLPDDASADDVSLAGAPVEEVP